MCKVPVPAKFLILSKESSLTRINGRWVFLLKGNTGSSRTFTQLPGVELYMQTTWTLRPSPGPLGMRDEWANHIQQLQEGRHK
jgi:hypothetical protein